MNVFDHPLDIGIVLGSTNDDIWEAEMHRHAGLEAMLVLGDCVTATCPLIGRRRHIQAMFEGSSLDDVLSVAERLVIHNGKPRDEIITLMVQFADEDERRTDRFRLTGPPEIRTPDFVDAGFLTELDELIDQALGRKGD